MSKVHDAVQPGHPTVEVISPLGYRADIDVKIADLIKKLWELGWDTSNSCENSFTYSATKSRWVHSIWIEFSDFKYLTNFIESFVSNSLERAVMLEDWVFEIHVRNENTTYDDQEGIINQLC